ISGRLGFPRIGRSHSSRVFRFVRLRLRRGSCREFGFFASSFAFPVFCRRGRRGRLSRSGRLGCSYRRRSLHVTFARSRGRLLSISLWRRLGGSSPLRFPSLLAFS